MIELGSSSGAANGERRLWNIIWKARVPQKIRIFAWRAATQSLAVQVNRVKHHQTTIGLCSICGVEDESVFHALVSCPKARALRLAVREVWNLLDEVVFNFTGPNWLLVLLDQVRPPVHEQIIFMFWRAWHLRNDLIFGKGKEKMSDSVRFIQNYWTSFSSCHPNVKMEISIKGKERVDGLNFTNDMRKNLVTWQAPATEIIKTNVDASYVEALRAASVGVVARNHTGEVIISSWDYIGVCNSAEEAELRATLAGLYIGITLHKAIILETDCSFVASFLRNDLLDRSPLVDLKIEALNLAKMMINCKISKINRTANRVAHEIAKFSFDNRSDGVLLNSVPPCVADFVTDDCMNILS
ncbi:unnamed protein product [Triticum turgidum subsp. durum]|uniref:RNase H type-1 domain-containing protein n=1 Tax=Triticum turgidum subsp. durum TaxID=4567 RepID=A0A9R1PVR7_TRITD|nr:unnamed protein product [Triticum turgidum subsp. durum]